MASSQQSSSQSSHGVSKANPTPESPYYIDPSETPEAFTPPLVLSGPSNYPKWYRAMNVALASKKKRGFVDGTIAVPAKDDDMYGAWKRCNELVLSWIRKALSLEIAETVHGMDKAVDVWRNFKNRFSLEDEFIISDILKEIHSLRQGEGTVTSYFAEFTLLWSELEILRPQPACTCEKKCSCSALQIGKEREKDKVVSFLKGLDDRFAATRLRIMRQDPLPSIYEVYAWVLQEDQTHMVSGANLIAQQSQDLKQHQSQPPSSSSTTIQATPETQAEKEVRKIEKLFLPTHPNDPLTRKPAGAPYKCSGCQELGFGPSYRCENNKCKCNYVLHEDCANAVVDNERNPCVCHPFFEKINFSFREKPPGRPRLCDACRKEVQGFEYHCEDTGIRFNTGLDLHPCCLKMKDSISYNEGDMTRTLKLYKTTPTACLKCKGAENEDKGWSYVYSHKKDYYCYHVSCFKELILEKWNEGYFSEEKMSMQTYDPKTQPPLIDKEIVKVGGSSKGSGTTKMVIKIAKVVFKLIFSLIFGDPVSLVLGLVEALVPDIG